MHATNKPFNIDKRLVYEAYKAVKSNRAAAGVARVKLIGDVEHLLALLQGGAGLLVMHHGRRKQCQARVVMFFVVRTKTSLRESATVLNAAEGRHR